MTTMQNRPATPAAVRAERQAPERPVGHTTGWWGMVLFVATEAMTFACFLASYFYLRFADVGAVWPPHGEPLPELFWSSLMTATLVLSCVPMALAVRAATRGRRGATAMAQVVTLLLGAAFVVFQVLDYYVTYPGSKLNEDVYGSLSYTITGLHTAHVIVGLLMLAVLVASTAAGRLGRRRPEPVGLVAIYWYFLAGLSVSIYVVVYISPYL